MPHSIIAAKGTNFTAKKFRDYCSQRNIKLDFASVAHLLSMGRSNEQTD